MDMSKASSLKISTSRKITWVKNQGGIEEIEIKESDINIY